MNRNKKLKNKNIDSLDHPLYGDNKKYNWKYGDYNAELLFTRTSAKGIADEQSLFEEIGLLDYESFLFDEEAGLYGLLRSALFGNELNLHSLDSDLLNYVDYNRMGAEFDIENSPFYINYIYDPQNLKGFISDEKEEKLAQEYFNTLEISKWPFKHVFLSAFFYLFKNAIFNEYSSRIIGYSKTMMPWFLQTTWGIEIKDMFISTNVLKKYSSSCTTGFYLFFSKLERKEFNEKEIIYNDYFENNYIFSKENLELFLSMLNTPKTQIDKLITECFATISLEPIELYLLKYNKLLKNKNE